MLPLIDYKSVQALVYAATAEDLLYLAFKYPVKQSWVRQRTHVDASWQAASVPSTALVVFGDRPKRGRKKRETCPVVKEYISKHLDMVRRGIVDCSFCVKKVKVCPLETESGSLPLSPEELQDLEQKEALELDDVQENGVCPVCKENWPPLPHRFMCKRK